MFSGKESSFVGELEKEVGWLLQGNGRLESDDSEKELNMYRSGSAPPTFEGSYSAVNRLFDNHGGGALPVSELSLSKSGNGNQFASDEELMSAPAYLSYYYSNVNRNPRLPPPLLSKEDWRFMQRLQGGSSAVGGIGDRRKVNRKGTGAGSGNDGGGGVSLISKPPGFTRKKPENEGEAEWGGDPLIGLPGLGLGSKEKSLAGILQNVSSLQDDLVHVAPGSGHPSHTPSRSTFHGNSDVLSEAELAQLQPDFARADTLELGLKIQNSSAVQHIGPPASSYSYVAALGTSLTRSTTPDPQHIPRALCPCPTAIGEGRIGTKENRIIRSNSFSGVFPHTNEPVDLVSALSELNLANGVMKEENHMQSHIAKTGDDHECYTSNLPGVQNDVKQHLHQNKSEHKSLYLLSPQLAKKSYSKRRGSGSEFSKSSVQVDMNYNAFRKMSPDSNPNGGGGLQPYHQHISGGNLQQYPSYGINGYSVYSPLSSMISGHLGNGNMPPFFENAAAASAMAVPGMDSKMVGINFPSDSNLNYSALESQNFSMAGGALQAPFVDPVYLQYLRTADYAAAQVVALNDPSADRNYMSKTYMDLLLKAYLGSLVSPQKSQYGNPTYGVGFSYPGSPLASPVIPNSPVRSGSPIRRGGVHMRLPSGMRNLTGAIIGPWHLDAGDMDNNIGSSLLEEFKSNKSRSFALSEIAGHVIEFSADQFGSRFIQQKLETATAEEKTMVYQETFHQALALMTDVFGNYVMQKFFEHGMALQRRELTNKLIGHVLTLSLHMYGCRVIQKAIEVADLDQKIEMVRELDGHVMHCVRDQNGNHVIQKCIECVPEEHIQFVISTFFGQVVNLSKHPYGCRVIQRVLVHCADPKTLSKVMDEVLGCVSILAQDQFGNYVVQHVLEHGKPHERSTIIQELAGKVVQMSQQKFASNVVEKCLTFGNPGERQLLVHEILGTTDENVPLQAMMKDQFANYVLQKVLETSSDQEREHILSRIKVHLNALKQYTYGKHIVARVERLVAAAVTRYTPILAACFRGESPCLNRHLRSRRHGRSYTAN